MNVLTIPMLILLAIAVYAFLAEILPLRPLDDDELDPPGEWWAR